MCGLCGAVGPGELPPISALELRAMRDVIAHRGPDDSGEHLGAGVALGSRRLSIVDLSEHGHMPMATPDGRYVIAYNGEVYNFRELRPALEARGWRFRSGTDTEVLLYLYAEEGPRMLERLNGMFGMAIWDTQERTLFLARDRLGVKPLYYAFDGDRMLFASEQKALFAAGVEARADPDTAWELLCFRYVAGERTPFAGVRRLLPGHYLTWRAGELRTHRWWSLRDSAAAPAARDVSSWYRDTFDDAVQLRRISDVPVGVLLSGGLDSGTVAASLARSAGTGVASFTVRFAERGYDEGPLARQVADRWGLEYHELVLHPDELFARLERATWLNDEPLVHGNEVHLWALSEYARERVTVLLSGEGADETLGGYVRYQPLRRNSLLQAMRMLRPVLPERIARRGRAGKLLGALALPAVGDMVLYNAVEALPAELHELGLTGGDPLTYRRSIAEEATRAHPGQPMRQAMYLDQHTFLCSLLDRNDRMTMGASIECRVPFLDRRLVEGVAGMTNSALLPGVRAKPLLRSALGDRLPQDVQRGRKWGFGVPWGRYLRSVNALRDVVDALGDSPVVRSSPIDGYRLLRTVRAFVNGDDRPLPLIRQLVMLSIWHQACVVNANARVATR